MRVGRSGLFIVTGLVGIALAGGGCATAPSAYDPVVRPSVEGQEYRGTVVRVDEPARVVVLDNGRMYRLSGDRAVLANGQPVVLDRVQPGTPVTIVAGTPVVYQNGQYVALAPATSGTVVAAPSSVVRTYGRVTDIDRDGTVTIKTADGREFDVRPPAGTVLRKGDNVAIDMTFGVPAR
jgi:hypothetical protein